MADERCPDEAGSIRRWSSGDNIRDGGAKASIEGGFWLGLFAILAAFVASAVAWKALGETSGAVYAAQMAERNAKLAQYQLEEMLRDAGVEPAQEPDQETE